jgi:hypothetical protein
MLLLFATLLSAGLIVPLLHWALVLLLAWTALGAGSSSGWSMTHLDMWRKQVRCSCGNPACPIMCSAQQLACGLCS